MAPTFRLHLKFVIAISAICFGFFLSCVESKSTSDDCKCGNMTSTGLALRVVGGRYLEEDEHPFLAILVKDSQIRCGGSIITRHFVLTAAHCIKKEKPLDNFYAVLGVHNTGVFYNLGNKSAIQSRAVERIIMHPRYKLLWVHEFPINDIALLQVKAIHFNARVQPICLPDIDLSRFKAAKVQGWGKTAYQGMESMLPKEAIVGLMSEAQCRKSPMQPKIGFVHNIHHMVLCAYESDTDACKGDSGGPLFLTNEKRVVYQIGIVSFGWRCGNTERKPSLYTRLSSYVDWIKQHIETVCSPIA